MLSLKRPYSEICTIGLSDGFGDHDPERNGLIAYRMTIARLSPAAKTVASSGLAVPALFASFLDVCYVRLFES